MSLSELHATVIRIRDRICPYERLSHCLLIIALTARTSAQTGPARMHETSPGATSGHNDHPGSGRQQRVVHASGLDQHNSGEPEW